MHKIRCASARDSSDGRGGALPFEARCVSMGRKVKTAATSTRTSVIDPGRKHQNDAHAQAILRLHARATDAVGRGDERGWRVLAELTRRQIENWEVPEAFAAASHDDLLPPPSSRQIGQLLVEQAFEPLRAVIQTWKAAGRPLAVTMNDSDYRLEVPSVYNPRKIIAPLTAHAAAALVEDVLALHHLMHDPDPRRLLEAERAYYARERTKLIELEHRLWQQIALHGGLQERIPYAFRQLLFLAAWHPAAHEPPNGAWTLCLRCGEVLHRKRRAFSTLPRCPRCMKETRAQREWPAHAFAPHGPGTWALRCQYPECAQAFEGPRHRKLCPQHTTSALPRSRRRSADQP
jgi:hypothetical protein